MNFSGVSAAAVLVFFAAAAGKSAKRRRWRMQRGDFEEVPRLAGTTVPGNRLARQCRGIGWHDGVTPAARKEFSGQGKGQAFLPQQFLYFLPLPQGNRRSAAGGGCSEAISRKCPDWPARQCRGIGWHDSAGESAGTTVLPRRPGRNFRDRERVRRFCRSSSYTSCRCRREIGEAPPVADAARRFRGSAPIGRHDSAGESAGTTVLPRRLSRIFRDRERVRRFCHSSSCISCRCRRGRGHCGRSSGPGGAAFSRCRHRRRSHRWPWPPAHA